MNHDETIIFNDYARLSPVSKDRVFEVLISLRSGSIDDLDFRESLLSFTGGFLGEDDELLGWSTNALVALDELAPGLIRRVVVSSALTRQAIFMALAQWSSRPRGAEAPSNEEATCTAVVLRSGWAKDIIAFQFGAVPEGLLGALERVGSSPFPSPHSYLRLWAIFTDTDPQKAVALRGIQQITARTLWVLDSLDPVLVHAEVLKRVETAAQACDLSRSIRFLQRVCSTATDEAISTALKQMTSPTALRRLVNRLLYRADHFPPQPYEGDHELRPLATARALVTKAREYRNCMASKIGETLVGGIAFAEFVGASQKVICEFRPLSSGRGWLLADVHVARNDPVPNELRQAVQEKCSRIGIPFIASPDADELRSLRRLTRQTDAFAFPNYPV